MMNKDVQYTKKRLDKIRKQIEMKEYEPVFITEGDPINEAGSIDPRTVVFIDDISNEWVDKQSE